MFDKKAQIGNLIRWAEPEQAEMRSVSYTQSFEVQRNPLCLPALTRGPTSERKAARPIASRVQEGLDVLHSRVLGRSRSGRISASPREGAYAPWVRDSRRATTVITPADLVPLGLSEQVVVEPQPTALKVNPASDSSPRGSSVACSRCFHMGEETGDGPKGSPFPPSVVGIYSNAGMKRSGKRQEN